MENRQKIPVPRRSFLWSLNETSGEILTHIGPTEFTPSANDRIVRANHLGGYEQAAMEARPFVLACEGEYVLLANPTAIQARGGQGSASASPNGEYVPGGNKERDLTLGTTKIIPGPCAFPLWPGQSAEVRPAHKLGANHYLLVEVVGPIDESAPYCDIVLKSARMSSVVIDAPDTSGSGSGSGSEQDQAELERSTPGHDLRLGQRIVVQGRHTSLFVPPTGIAVVAAQEDTPPDSEGNHDAVSNLGGPVREELAGLVAKVAAGLSAKQFSTMKNELRHRAELSLGERAIMLTAMDEAWSARSPSKPPRRSDHRRHPHALPMDPYARRAVVLSPKNFCFLFDADGNPRIVEGPARVFPGPHDTFLQRGSRRRVYDAYELSENQALWLRIISPISREALSQRLPRGYVLDQEHYGAGAELLVRGLPSVYFPFIEAEVLHPETGDPHVGNDHEAVIINAIGVDPKSGIYVRDKATGKVRLVRGEVSYLVDPRREEHVHRRCSAKDWNLWIARGSTPRQAKAEVTTPWALSVVVPTNHAMQLGSGQGRRVVVGPALELLEYDEQPTALTLSKGAHKDGRTTISTCLLRVRGARFRDRFEVESKDLTRFEVEVGIAGRFVETAPEEDADSPHAEVGEVIEVSAERWFSVEDPVKQIAMVIRERVRRAARELPALELFQALAEGVGEAGLAPLAMADCGVVLDGVELIGSTLVDGKLAVAFEQAHKGALELQLQDRQAERRLASVRLRDVVDAEEHAVARQANARMAETGRAELDDQQRIELRKLELESEREKLQVETRGEREALAVESRLALAKVETEARVVRKLRDAEAEAQARKLVDAVLLDASRARAEIDRANTAAAAQADSLRLAAVQPELVGALHAAADAEVMKAAAENMNLVSLLGGKSPMELFTKLLAGTPLARSVRSMRRRDGSQDGSQSGGSKVDPVD